MGSRSTRAEGKRRCKASQAAQWVVTRRPSRSPAAPSRNAPVHTELIRRARGAVRLIHDTSGRSRMASRVPSPPATIRVSMGPVI